MLTKIKNKSVSKKVSSKSLSLVKKEESEKF